MLPCKDRPSLVISQTPLSLVVAQNNMASAAAMDQPKISHWLHHLMIIQSSEQVVVHGEKFGAVTVEPASE